MCSRLLDITRLLIINFRGACKPTRPSIMYGVIKCFSVRRVTMYGVMLSVNVVSVTLVVMYGVMLSVNVVSVTLVVMYGVMLSVNVVSVTLVVMYGALKGQWLSVTLIHQI